MLNFVLHCLYHGPKNRKLQELLLPPMSCKLKIQKVSSDEALAFCSASVPQNKSAPKGANCIKPSPPPFWGIADVIARALAWDGFTRRPFAHLCSCPTRHPLLMALGQDRAHFPLVAPLHDHLHVSTFTHTPSGLIHLGNCFICVTFSKI